MPIIDAHCHIYPDKIAAKAVKSIQEFYDIDMGEDGTVDTLVKEGQAAGITHFLVHSVSTSPKQVKSINEYIASEVHAHPGLMTGFGTLHPDSEDVEGDVKHLLELGLEGVKLHPDFQKFAIDSDESIRLCSAFAGKVPLLVHGGDVRHAYSNPSQLKKLMKALPELVVIGAHFAGWSCWEKSADILAGTPNLYVDCSSSLYALRPDVANKLFHAFGTDRVLFGTDYPMWDPLRS